LFGFSQTKNFGRRVSLQHHVVSKNRRQSDIGGAETVDRHDKQCGGNNANEALIHGNRNWLKN
jgi:hypothetical protein